jgi:hypothetical protein
LKLWVLATAPLVGHFLLTILIAITVIHSIDNHAFHISFRKPPVTQFDGTITHSASSRPLQRDITTAISTALTVMPLVSGLWTTAMAWCCTFILMEKAGVTLKDINWITTYQMPAELRARRGITIVIIAIILLLAFPSQLAAPILTGSITWAPGEIMVQGVRPATGITRASDGLAWQNYRGYIEDVRAVSARALGVADTAWGGYKAGTTMKRVLSSTSHLPVNSTLNNVTVPYFTVDAIEWIKNPVLNDPNPANRIDQHDIDAIQPGALGSSYPYFVATLVAALIPDGGWDPPTTPFPPPSKISETRTLWTLYNHQLDSTLPCVPSTDGYFGGLPSDVHFYKDIQIHGTAKSANCIVFARVTYTAGAAVCESCRLSASTVVEPDTAVQVIEDPMTFEATTLMPLLSTNMGLGGSSVSPSADITQYINDILPRSYRAAWTALSDYLSTAATLTTNVTIPVSVSIARVVHWRVYLWVVLNIMLTFSGLLLLFIQYHCKNTLVVDVGMAVFLLDTQRVLEQDHSLSNLSKLTKEHSQTLCSLKWQEGDGYKYVDVE